MTIKTAFILLLSEKSQVTMHSFQPLSVLKQWHSNKKHTVTFTSLSEEFYDTAIGLSVSF